MSLLELIVSGGQKNPGDPGGREAAHRLWHYYGGGVGFHFLSQKEEGRQTPNTHQEGNLRISPIPHNDPGRCKLLLSIPTEF
jgi:hypothetical protein